MGEKITTEMLDAIQDAFNRHDVDGILVLVRGGLRMAHGPRAGLPRRAPPSRQEGHRRRAARPLRGHPRHALGGPAALHLRRRHARRVGVDRPGHPCRRRPDRLPRLRSSGSFGATRWSARTPTGSTSSPEPEPPTCSPARVPERFAFIAGRGPAATVPRHPVRRTARLRRRARCTCVHRTQASATGRPVRPFAGADRFSRATLPGRLRRAWRGSARPGCRPAPALPSCLPPGRSHPR